MVAGLSIALAAAGCSSEGSTLGTGSSAGSGSGSAAAKPTGSGGGFSADLAKEFAAAGGSGSAGSGEAVAMAGSGSGSAVAPVPAPDPKPAAGSGSAVAPVPAPDPKPAAGSGSAAVVAPMPAPDPKPAIGPGPLIQASGSARPRIAVPPQLAAIQISLGPNWERDVVEAGTISFGVKIPNRTDSAVFVFRYGYEDASAPADRDAYKKWLADRKLLTVRQDRQAGAAWFIEGTDGAGSPAFRVVVNWGGKKLICYGSLYKDGESNKLGDLRDQAIIQAKQICETVAL